MKGRLSAAVAIQFKVLGREIYRQMVYSYHALKDRPNEEGRQDDPRA